MTDEDRSLLILVARYGSAFPATGPSTAPCRGEMRAVGWGFADGRPVV